MSQRNNLQLRKELCVCSIVQCETKWSPVVQPRCPDCALEVDLDDINMRYACIWCHSSGQQSKINWTYKLQLTILVMRASSNTGNTSVAGQLLSCMAYDDVVERLVGIDADQYAQVKRYYPQLDDRLEERLVGLLCAVKFRERFKILADDDEDEMDKTEKGERPARQSKEILSEIILLSEGQEMKQPLLFPFNENNNSFGKEESISVLKQRGDPVERKREITSRESFVCAEKSREI